MGKFYLDRYKFYIWFSGIFLFYFLIKYLPYGFKVLGGGADLSYVGFAALPAGLSEFVTWVTEKIIRKKNEETYKKIIEKRTLDYLAVALLLFFFLVTNYLFNLIAKNGFSVHHVGRILFLIVFGPPIVKTFYDRLLKRRRNR